MRTERSRARSYRAALIVGVMLAAFDAHADGPMFRSDPAHTGLSDSPKVPTLASIRWKFASKGKVISTPAVVGGIVYVGSSDHAVYALDAATGALRWRYVTGGGVESSPAVANGFVFVVSRDGNLDAEGRIEYSKIYSGSTLDAMIVGLDRLYTLGSVLSSPVVVDGVAYFGSTDGNVYAVE